MIDRIEGDRVILDCSADQGAQRWRDESRERALFEREDQGEAGPAHARSQLLGHLPLEPIHAPSGRHGGPAAHPLSGRAFLVRRPRAYAACPSEEKMTMARAWHLMSRPQGLPTDDNFELKAIELPPLRRRHGPRRATAGCRSTRTCAGG